MYTRDRAKFRELLRESLRLHAELRRRWPKLRQQYRAALPELVSAEAWQTDVRGAFVSRCPAPSDFDPASATIVVVTYNRSGLLTGLLDSIVQMDPKPGHVVVDRQRLVR